MPDLSILLKSGLCSPVFGHKAGPPARHPGRGTVRSRGGKEPRWPRSSRHSPEPAFASADPQLQDESRHVKEANSRFKKFKPMWSKYISSSQSGESYC